MSQIRKCKKLHRNGLTVEEIAKQLDMKEKRVAECLNFSFRYEQLILANDDDDVALEENPHITPIGENVSKKAMKRIIRPMLKEIFCKLSAREQYIIGSYFGLYGYDEMSAAEIAEIEMVKRDAVDKAINTALKKLYEYYEDSEIKYWINTYLTLKM